MKNVRQQTRMAVAFAVVFPTLVTWVYFILYDGQSAVLGGVSKAIQFAFPACWVFLWMRMSLREAGLPESASDRSPWSVQRSLVGGFTLGLAIVITMIAYYRFAITDSAFTRLAIEIGSRVDKLSLANPLGYAALGVFYSLVHSCLEEYYFRWFVFGRLRQLVSFAPAAIASGLAFMAHHVIVLYVFFGPSFHTWFLSASIAVGGILWAWLYERSRSLLGSWTSHLLVDAGIFLIGYHIIFIVLPDLPK